MNNNELSYKLKYIVHELGITKKDLLTECRKFSPSLSKPTLLNAINGRNTTAPTIETLSAIIKVCQTSGNEKLKHISYDFLLNDNIQEVEANNSTVYQSIGLSDEVIDRLKQFNHPLYFDYGSIINYFFIHTPAKYWQYLEMLKATCDIKNTIKKTKTKNENNKYIKELFKLWDNEGYQLYVRNNFRSAYDLLTNLKNNNEDILSKLDELNNQMVILEKHFKYLLLELQNNMYDYMNE